MGHDSKVPFDVTGYAKFSKTAYLSNTAYLYLVLFNYPVMVSPYYYATMTLCSSPNILPILGHTFRSLPSPNIFSTSRQTQKTALDTNLSPLLHLQTFIRKLTSPISLLTLYTTKRFVIPHLSLSSAASTVAHLWKMEGTEQRLYNTSADNNIYALIWCHHLESCTIVPIIFRGIICMDQELTGHRQELPSIRPALHPFILEYLCTSCGLHIHTFVAGFTCRNLRCQLTALQVTAWTPSRFPTHADSQQNKVGVGRSCSTFDSCPALLEPQETSC